MINKKILFMAGNSPLPLQANIMHLLSETDGFDVELVYQNRQGTTNKWPFPRLLSSTQISEISWPVGRNIIAKLWNKVAVIALFVRHIRRSRPDIIHACSPFETLLAARCAYGRVYTPKIIYALQDTCDWMHSWGGRLIQRWALRKVDTIFVTSDAFEDRFLRKLNLIGKDTKVVYVPNVPESNLLSPTNVAIDRDCLTVGWIGTFRGVEGLNTLIEGALNARKRGANVRVLFAGAGGDAALVEKFSLNYDFVEYTGPYKFDEEIHNLYSRVDVVYALYDRSYDKQIHIACRLCEAINCGLPILVGSETHMAGIVENEKIGVSVPFGDAHSLGTALLDLYENPGKRKEMAQHCEPLRDQYVFDFYKDRILAVYTTNSA